jgi:hypothetical protein
MPRTRFQPVRLRRWPAKAALWTALLAAFALIAGPVFGAVSWLTDHATGHHRAWTNPDTFLPGPWTWLSPAEYLISAVAVGALAGFVGAVCAGIHQSLVIAPSGEPTRPARWTTRSGWNGLGVGGAVGVATAIGVFLISGAQGLSVAAWWGVLAGAVYGLRFGGFAFLSKLGLRLDLADDGVLPVRVTRFLRRVADRGLLDQHPGGWAFRHETIRLHLMLDGERPSSARPQGSTITGIR